MAKPRRQTYTLQMYLQKMKELDIRSDQDVQRLSGAWNNNMVNELVLTVLTGDYIPPVILGEEGHNSQLWLIDGLQRSTALMMFRDGKYKITPSIEEPVISYRAKVRDSEGEVKIDGNGDICWETRAFDLRRKTYSQLPEELQKVFNEYQVETVIHENYNMQQISKLVRRYNNHKAMNVSQKAFTFVDKYARKIREILKREFFIEAEYTKAERKNGTMERILMESVMVMFHLDSWRKSSRIGAYLNENSTREEFDILENCIERLETIISEDLYSIFTAKNSFLWFALFHKFTKLNMDDKKFSGFLHAFQNGLDRKEINGKAFGEIGQERSTKDRTVIMEKMELLETLMLEYLGISKPEPEPEADSEKVLEFVRKNVVPFAAKEDIEQYAEVLDSLLEKSNCDAKLLKAENKLSLVGIVAYSFKNDIDLDNWIVDYCDRNSDYIPDQAENYEHMKNDLQQFLKLADAA